MGALVTRATGTLVSVIRGVVDGVRLAEQIEGLLGEDLLEETQAVGSFYLVPFGPPKTVVYTIYDENKRTDRTFLHKVRRALRVPHMARILVHGDFRWVGVSDVLFDNDLIEITISAAKNGCEIKRIEEQITRVRFEADCTAQDNVLTEEAEGVKGVPALAIS